jgi:hypothetical protein
MASEGAMRIGLVGCVKTKRSSPSPARDLYVSTLFTGRRRYVEQSCDVWFVLSARHGLVPSDERLEPYDETLNDQSAGAKRRWAQAVLAGLDAIGFDYSTTTFEIHAGNEYRSFGLVEGLERRGATVEVPAAHLGQGEQLAFYSGRGTKLVAPSYSSSAATPRRNVSAGATYQPLSAHLGALGQTRVALTFSAIERILGRALPASARKHRAWWSNEQSGSHSHARAWMDVGWRVAAVDFNAGRVEFERGLR